MNIEDLLQRIIVSIGNQAYVVQNIIKSIILIVSIIVLRSIIIKNIYLQKKLSNDEKRKWTVNVRNFSLFVILILLIVIWGYQIKEFAFSIAAVAVAFAMSFKEMITNFMGGVARTISQQYSVGDRVTVGNFRGDVIDTNMLTTTLLEVGPGQTNHQHTGCTVSIPNSILLSTPVINETSIKDYLLHSFRVVVAKDADWKKSEKKLLEAANIVCAPYLNKAKNHFNITAMKVGVEPPTVDPRVMLAFNNADEVEILVSLPVPSKRRGVVEQEVIRRYLEMLDSVNNSTGNTNSSDNEDDD